MLHKVGMGASGRYLAKGPEPRSYSAADCGLCDRRCVLGLQTHFAFCQRCCQRRLSPSRTSQRRQWCPGSVRRECSPRIDHHASSALETDQRCSSTSGRRVVCGGVTLLAALVLALTGRSSNGTVHGSTHPSTAIILVPPCLVAVGQVGRWNGVMGEPTSLPAGDLGRMDRPACSRRPSAIRCLPSVACMLPRARVLVANASNLIIRLEEHEHRQTPARLDRIRWPQSRDS